GLLPPAIAKKATVAMTMTAAVAATVRQRFPPKRPSSIRVLLIGMVRPRPVPRLASPSRRREQTDRVDRGERGGARVLGTPQRDGGGHRDCDAGLGVIDGQWEVSVPRCGGDSGMDAPGPDVVGL